MSFDKYFHDLTNFKFQHRLVMDVVISQSIAIIKSLPSVEKVLLIQRDALFVLDIFLDLCNCIRWYNIKLNHLPLIPLHINSHCMTESQH